MTRPVRVRLRDSSSSWYEWSDRLELVVHRRVGGAEGGWNHLRFPGPTEAACEAAYDDYCRENYEASVRRAAARAKHGIKSYL